MAFKVLIGSAPRGGNTQQQADALKLAAEDLEAQLNEIALGVDSIQSTIVDEMNPIAVEIIAFVKTKEITAVPKKGV